MLLLSWNIPSPQMDHLVMGWRSTKTPLMLIKHQAERYIFFCLNNQDKTPIDFVWTIKTKCYQCLPILRESITFFLKMSTILTVSLLKHSLLKKLKEQLDFFIRFHMMKMQVLRIQFDRLTYFYCARKSIRRNSAPVPSYLDQEEFTQPMFFLVLCFNRYFHVCNDLFLDNTKRNSWKYTLVNIRKTKFLRKNKTEEKQHILKEKSSIKSIFKMKLTF